jgi:sugar transferase (PEP-CTERM system associated)
MVLRVFRHFVPVSIICLALSDLFLVFLAFHLVSTEDSFLSTHLSDTLRSPSLKLSVMIGIGAVISGLYDGKAFLNYRSMVLQIFLSSFFSCIVIAFGDYFLSYSFDPKDWFWEVQKAAFTWLVCILFTRAVFITIADLDTFKRRMLIIGTGEQAERIVALAACGSKPHVIPLAYLHEKIPLWTSAENPEIDGANQNTILRRARELQANEIVIATDDRQGLPMTDLLQCRREGIRVTNYLDFIERETNSIDIAALQPGWLVFSDGFRVSRWASFCKRSADIFLSAVLLSLTLPLMMFTCVLILFDSPGPVLYRQERVGLGGRPFVLLKFRSMHTDAEKDGVARWAATEDCRITRVGRFIRKLRIDELPQLVNVLRGDMSFVGPRPERTAFVDKFTKQIPFYAERHWVKPGITGWAQIKYQYGASLEDARVKLSYDLYYVKNRGLFLDLIITLRTVRVILWADGAR